MMAAIQNLELSVLFPSQLPINSVDSHNGLSLHQSDPATMAWLCGVTCVSVPAFGWTKKSVNACIGMSPLSTNSVCV